MTQTKDTEDGTGDSEWQPEARIYVPALDRELPLLMDVKDAGRLAGLSRFAAYRAVNEGVMPSMQMGERRVLVPTATWLEKLGLKYGPKQMPANVAALVEASHEVAAIMYRALPVVTAARKAALANEYADTSGLIAALEELAVAVKVGDL